MIQENLSALQNSFSGSTTTLEDWTGSLAKSSSSSSCGAGPSVEGATEVEFLRQQLAERDLKINELQQELQATKRQNEKLSNRLSTVWGNTSTCTSGSGGKEDGNARLYRLNQHLEKLELEKEQNMQKTVQLSVALAESKARVSELEGDLEEYKALVMRQEGKGHRKTKKVSAAGISDPRAATLATNSCHLPTSSSTNTNRPTATTTPTMASSRTGLFARLGGSLREIHHNHSSHKHNINVMKSPTSVSLLSSMPSPSQKHAIHDEFCDISADHHEDDDTDHVDDFYSESSAITEIALDEEDDNTEEQQHDKDGIDTGDGITVEKSNSHRPMSYSSERGTQSSSSTRTRKLW